MLRCRLCRKQKKDEEEKVETATKLGTLFRLIQTGASVLTIGSSMERRLMSVTSWLLSQICSIPLPFCPPSLFSHLILSKYLPLQFLTFYTMPFLGTTQKKDSLSFLLSSIFIFLFIF